MYMKGGGDTEWKAKIIRPVHRILSRGKDVPFTSY